MKHTFLIAALLLQPIFSFAQPATPQPSVLVPNDGRDAGYTFCSTLGSGSNKNECMRMVTQSQFIDTVGLEGCRDRYFDSEKLSCLKIVINHVFDINLVRFCNKLDSPNNKNSCFSSIIEKTANLTALATCSGMTFDSEKINCLNTIVYPIIRPQPRPELVPIPMPQPEGCNRIMFKQLLNSLQNSVSSADSRQFFQVLNQMSSLIDRCFP